MGDSAEKFVLYDKMSKKQKKAQNDKKRVLWEINPVTRKPKNPKAYDRESEKKRVLTEVRE